MDDAAFEGLIRQNYAGLLALVRRRARDENVAADLVNDAIVLALEHYRAGRIADPERIGGYIFQVAMNLLRNHRRKSENRGDLRADPELIDRTMAADEPADGLDARTLARVRSAIESLPAARDREIVKRFYLDEEEKDSICGALGLSTLHFDKVIFRARKRLKDLLSKTGVELSSFFYTLCATC